MVEDKGNYSKVKKPRSSFLFFSKEIGDEVKQQLGQVAQSEVSKALGNRWHEMTEEQKAVYIERARADKERY